jgi:CDGSH iron-sulfur domain-containing protein 3
LPDNSKEHAVETEPKRPQMTPYAVEVEAGKRYFWCACGHSKTQPFCDGSHKGSTFVPVKYDADAARKVFFCGCKGTGNSPLCDGSHSRL